MLYLLLVGFFIIFLSSLTLTDLFFFFLMIRRPPRSTLFPTRRSSDLGDDGVSHGHKPRGGLGWWRAGASPRHVHVGVIIDRKSTRLNSSHSQISYAVFCLKKKKNR